jgi:hypothetical protein
MVVAGLAQAGGVGDGRADMGGDVVAAARMWDVS